MKPLRGLLLLPFCLLVLPVRGVVLNLVGPPAPVMTASEVKLTLVILNPAKEETTLTLPEALAGRLSSDTNNWTVELTAPALGDEISIAAGGFAVREYLVKLPAHAEGRLVLEVDRPVAARVAIEARSGLTKNATVQAPLSNFVPPQTTVSAIQRTFAGRFSAHEPSYFIYGPDEPAAKFQFSFKYRLFGTRSELGEMLPALQGVYFGFTQRSLWDIEAKSSPFYDTSYMPEIMFESQAIVDPESPGGMKWMGYQAGVRHESNGRSGLTSRSMNIVYFRPGVAFGRFDGWNVILAPRVFAYVSDLDNNPDIADYRGNLEFLAVFGRNDNFALAVTGRFGRGGHHGSLQADLTLPVKFDRVFDFATYLLVQYWDGYGESLIDYNVRTSSIRAGFSLVR